MKEKILVIDDIENIAFIVKTILSREGYDVTTAYAIMTPEKRWPGQILI